MHNKSLTVFRIQNIYELLWSFQYLKQFYGNTVYILKSISLLSTIIPRNFALFWIPDLFM